MSGVGYNPGTATTIAADIVGGQVIQRVKLVHGADNTNLGDIAPTNPLPVTQISTAAVVGTVAISGAAQVSGTVSVS